MRNFSKSQKTAVELVTGQSGDGDHIKPYSRGGDTTVENCQLLPRELNAKKGAFKFEARRWQIGFFKSWEQRGDNLPFMLIAIPGSGKTWAALEAARRWMAAGVDRRMVVVVPTDNLRTQWKTEATQFGINLQSKEFGTSFKSDYQGGVVTYHLAANQPLVFRKLCSVHPTMVIFDEIHHCGEDSHFGRGIKDGFELAKEKLLMSGTPWKSDGAMIPFVRYDGDGYALGDFRYDYPDALVDEVVRYLVFDHAKGSLEHEITGQKLELNGDISERDAAQRLRLLLDPDGDYLKTQIQNANAKLIACRSTVPDAAAMAVCIDQWHAVKVAKVIEAETGVKPSIIVSDSDVENDTVDKFRKAKSEWLVSVRKVSEGTDIKRLQVLCYLTNVTSELFFRQVIGRVSRVRGLEDYEGYVYLPADPRLINAARNIENAQVIATKEAAQKELAEKSERAAGELDLMWKTQHEGTETVMIGNVRVDVGEAREIERIAQATGLSMQKVMEVRALSGSVTVKHDENKPLASLPVNMEEVEMRLRKDCNKLAFRLARALGIEVQEVHKKFKKQDQMSIDDLESKKRKLLTEIRIL
jgi:superfamily II DNA or RNA helicase